MSAMTVSFVGHLSYRHPSLLSLFEEHLEANEGEVLPHLFISDVARLCRGAVEDGGADDVSLVQSILDECEKAATRSEELEGLMAVSFMEALIPPTGADPRVMQLLGPRLSMLVDDLSMN